MAPPADPWQSLLQAGGALVSALAAANDADAPAHSWIELDTNTGIKNLKFPLPPPETVKRIADVFQVFADTLRSRFP